MNIKRTYIIYKHTNKINNKSYIGQTYFEHPEVRWNSGKNYKTSPKFYNAIKKYGWDNFEHTILKTNIQTKNEADNLEKYYIKLYDTIAHGYNISRGGDDHTYSAKEVYQLSETKTIINKFVSLLAAEDATGIAAKNIYRACAHKNKSAGGYYWCYAQDYTAYDIQVSKRLIASRPIYQLDLNDCIVARFSSMSEAARILKFNSCSKISMCCNNKRKTAYGYKWRYVDEERTSKN